MARTAIIHQFRPNNLNRLDQRGGYRFQERSRDPDLEWICQEITSQDLSISEVQEKVLDASNSSVWISYSTIAKWLDRTTKRPQNFTMRWVTYALGYEITRTPRSKN